MRQIGEVNEGTSALVTLAFTDEAGAAVTPMSGTYRIDTGNGTVLRASTAFSPTGNTHQLLLNAADNTIKDVELVTEPHILTVTWVFGSGDRTGTEECRYDVKNLQHA